MANPRLESVIIGSENKGKGTSSASPVREVTVIYRTDGTKIAECDPHSFTIEQITAVISGKFNSRSVRSIVKELMNPKHK